VNKTQADLERQLSQRQLQIDAEMMTPEDAFSAPEEWITDLGGRRAFLHPQHRQWMWHDPLHDEWVFAECGLDEGILITMGGAYGVKKLPQPDNVSDWCVVLAGDQVDGPIRIVSLREKLEGGGVSDDFQIWSTRSTEWLKGNSEEAQKLIYGDPSEDETILRK
jgi:hypothetical protein